MPDQETMSALLNAYGVSAGSSGAGFNWVNLLLGIMFGIVGMYAFNQGRKERNYKPLVIGVALMGYPYFVSNTWLVLLIGIALTAALYFWRD